MKSNRNFGVLMLGQSLANIGDVLYTVSIISVLFSLTHSATISALVPFTITFAMFVSSILTPLLLGKMNLKLLLLSSQIGKTVILCGLSSFLMIGLELSNYYLVFVMIAGIALLDGCANPIRQTLLPYYVKEEHLLQANGIAETITQSIQIGTWFFGSLLLIMFNAIQLSWFVTALFAVSSIILSLLHDVEHKAEARVPKKALLTQGWQLIQATPVLKTLVRMEIFETIASSVWIAAILYVFVDQALQAQEQWWGFINSSFFIGLVIGSIICVKYSRFVDDHRNVFIIIGAVMTCLFTLLFGTTSSPVLALILSACIGLFGQLKNIPQQTLIQTSVPKEQLATVYTSIGAVSMGTFGFASLFMGTLSDYLGVRSVFIISGVLLGIVSLIAYNHNKRFEKNSKQVNVI